MKRWIVKTSDNKTLKLYYNKKDDIYKHYKDVLSIELDNNIDYLQYIEKIKEYTNFIGYDYKKREVYKKKLDDGDLIIKLFKIDNQYLDGVLYQFIPNNIKMLPVTFTLSTPYKIIEKFFKPSVQYILYSFRKYGEPKLQKPKELKNIKQSFSVDFIPNKCKCSCFIKNDDLWIKHRDYFSTCYKPNISDIGTPLNYRLEKYFSTKKSSKFIYEDSWGSIVLRNEAWLCFKNIKHIILRNSHNAVAVMLDLMAKNDINMNQNTEELAVWERFFENVVKEYKNELNRILSQS